MTVHSQKLVKHLRTLPRKGQKSKKDDPVDSKSFKDMENVFKGASENIKKSFEAIATENTLLQAGLGVTINSFTFFSDVITETSKRINFFENEFGQLAKTLGVNTKVAANYGHGLSQLATRFGAGAKQANRFATELSKILPFQQKQIIANEGTTKAIFKTNTAMRVQLGLTEQQAERFTLMHADNAENLDTELAARARMINSINKATGLEISFSQVMGDVLTLSEDIQAQYSRYPGNLETAAIKARMMGIQLSKLNSIGGQLLNIEDSIGAELEYQLLSGKRLVDQQGRSLTNMYREATLQGDASKQADTLREIVKSQGKDLETNLYARKKLAQLLGVEEAELIRINKQEQLRAKYGEDLFAAIDKPEFKDKLKQQIELDPNYTTEEQREKAFKDALSAFDTRTQDQKFQMKIEASLTTIVGALLKGKKVDDVMETGFEAMNKAYSALDLFATGIVNNENGLNAVKTATKIAGGANAAIPAVDKLNTTVIQLIPGLEEFGTAVANFTKRIDSIVSIKAGSYGGTIELEQQPALNDAIIMGNKITPIDTADQAYAVMKPGGAIARANDSYNTNVSIDYNALAAAVASAMRNVSINVSATQLATQIEYANGQQLNA